MNRNTFFKSLAVLIGVAATKPSELFSEKKKDSWTLQGGNIGEEKIIGTVDAYHPDIYYYNGCKVHFTPMKIFNKPNYIKDE